jgi:hypothetical protein
VRRPRCRGVVSRVKPSVNHPSHRVGVRIPRQIPRNKGIGIEYRISMCFELTMCIFIIPHSAMNGMDTNFDPSCGTYPANRSCWALVVVTITEGDKSNNGKGAPIEVGAIRRVKIPEELKSRDHSCSLNYPLLERQFGKWVVGISTLGIGTMTRGF